ncbi:CocE/NonD family hydrolase [Nocardia fusca]|uniref:CocE/NonD family hydrolase n=1 Tax=Nocardia fusca TaxID=941183 RepID=UPI0037B40143
MTTRGGATLRANVWRPAGGAAPTLLARHPYGKERITVGGGPGTPMSAMMGPINAGYAVVMQDARGAFESDGGFTPKVNELTDGVDLMAWCAESDAASYWCLVPMCSRTSSNLPSSSSKWIE